MGFQLPEQYREPEDPGEQVPKPLPPAQAYLLPLILFVGIGAALYLAQPREFINFSINFAFWFAVAQAIAYSRSRRRGLPSNAVSLAALWIVLVLVSIGPLANVARGDQQTTLERLSDEDREQVQSIISAVGSGYIEPDGAARDELWHILEQYGPVRDSDLEVLQSRLEPSEAYTRLFWGDMKITLQTGQPFRMLKRPWPETSGYQQKDLPPTRRYVNA
jgi:hypothetical protein